MKKTKILALMLVLVVVMSFGLAGCSGESDVLRLVVNEGPNPDTLDPALNSASDGGVIINHAFSGMTTWSTNDEGLAYITNDCAEDIKVSDDGLVYTITLKEGLKWSNGDPLLASDFKWSWDRVVDPNTGADYSNMFSVFAGYEEGKLQVTADDATRTVVATMKVPTPYFTELLAFPTFFPVNRAIVEANPDTWATRHDTYIGNGAYQMTEWVLDSKIVFEKNENFHFADRVTIPELEFALSADENAALANFKNGTYQYIKSIPTDEMDSLRASSDEIHNFDLLGTYYFSWNVNYDLSPEGKTLTETEQAEVRRAITLLINRPNVSEVSNIDPKAANSFVPYNLMNQDGSSFTASNGPDRDGTGYYSIEDVAGNRTKALEILAKYYDVEDNKVKNFPTLNLLKNEGAPHAAIGTAIQSDLQAVGINLTMEDQEWATFLDSRKTGHYDIARNGWLGDYTHPLTFLDMWESDGGNNDAQLGKGAHADLAIYGENKNQTWAEAYDGLIDEIRNEPDMAKNLELCHQAEDMLMETGCLVPLYAYNEFYMMSNEVEGVIIVPKGYKYFMYATYTPAK